MGKKEIVLSLKEFATKNMFTFPLAFSQGFFSGSLVSCLHTHTPTLIWEISIFGRGMSVSSLSLSPLLLENPRAHPLTPLLQKRRGGGASFANSKKHRIKKLNNQLCHIFFDVKIYFFIFSLCGESPFRETKKKSLFFLFVLDTWRMEEVMVWVS